MCKYVIGIDYGTDSCRAVITDTANGAELAAEVFYYPRWKQGLYCDAQKMRYRQHPLDYIEGLKHTVKSITQTVSADVRENIIAISVDTTGSTPCAVNQNGVPLALLPEFAENPNAMFILWKDHTAIEEAAEITKAAKKSGVDYTKYIGGVYSSEWFFAKILHTLRTDAAVRGAAHTWVEHCDWIPFYMTGETGAANIKRSRCAAGHKAMWNEEFGGLPPEDFLSGIDGLLNGFERSYFDETYTSDRAVGEISPELARELGLPRGVKIGAGAFDCHMGAVGGNIAPGVIVKVIGTSTCDVIIADEGIGLVGGICGQVDGSVIPGMIGLEAGQSAYGDLYAWYKKIIGWSFGLLPAGKLSADEIAALENSILFELEKAAAKTETPVLALDWINGRRTPYADQNLKGVIAGLTLAADAPQIYRALIEATAFGSRAIIDRFRECGVPIDYAIAIGGVAKKSPLGMQILADVCEMPVKVCRSEQACALGASIFAAVAGGAYADVASAQRCMASEFETEYYPCAENAAVYKEKYARYRELGGMMEGFEARK